jgi:sugar phosphate isomerase/epimerase
MRDMPDPGNPFTASKDAPRIGIGSYAFRYNIGFDGFAPCERMGLFEFIDAAEGLGLQGVQFCENLNYAGLSGKILEKARATLADRGMFVELGMRDMSYDNLMRHVEIAEMLGSDLIRVVAGTPSAYPDAESGSLKRQLLDVFERALPEIQEKELRIGLENHFDLPTRDLVSVVEKVGSSNVGMVFDTTNGLGFIERPEETLELLLPHLLSIHLKDYVVQKVEAGYLVRGAVLGEGYLDYKGLLTRAFSQKSLVSVVLEMTVRRDDEMNVEETVIWERNQVERSAEELKRFVTSHGETKRAGGSNV